MTEVMAAYGDGLAAAAGPVGARAIHMYPVSNYTFGSKAAKADKDATVAEAMIRSVSYTHLTLPTNREV